MKNWRYPSKLQWFSFFASMPFITILGCYILYDGRLFRDIRVWLVAFPVIYVGGLLIFRLQCMIGNYIKYRNPAISQTTRRVFLYILFIMPFMACGVSLLYLVFHRFSVLGYSWNTGDYFMSLLLGFCVNLVFETLYESAFVLDEYKETLKEKQQLEDHSVYAEFTSLKNQVNPHFLFNCFNTLSSLISEDRAKAGKFLDELSKVYRYLLRNNEDGLSTVQNEIRFIESYYQLLQTRHGQAVQINMEIDKRYDMYLLPSLSLQLLVENVVKHNVLSKNKPLIIDIFTTAGNKLVVNNNLQRRSVKAPSNKVGLDNIRTKYNLLQQPGFQVMEDKNNFTVVLPLIWNNGAAGISMIPQRQYENQ
ncbi:MAG: histidine kinase [Chitinophagaceae bacterium]